MTKPTILFRADGGPSIGMGHFIRTLALAEMLNKHFHCIYVTRQPSKYQIAEIQRICHSFINLPEDDSHYNQFLALLKGDEIVVLDNYYFTTDYQRAIKSKGCKLICIDDMHDKHYVADIVINHAEGINSLDFSLESYTKLLLGFPYALIRKEFRNAERYDFKKKYFCMVMMGGVDPLNITRQILNTIADDKYEKSIVVIDDKVQYESQTSENVGNFIFFKKQTSRQIAQLMQNSGFGIFPASTVALEACAVHLPFICGFFVDNQKDIYRGIERNHLAVCIGNLHRLQSKQLKEAINIISSENNYKSIISNQREFMDNQSDKRLLKIFKEL